MMDFDLELFNTDSVPCTFVNEGSTDNVDANISSRIEIEATDSLAKKMEEDKRNALAFGSSDPDMKWLESTSDFQSFMDLSNDINEVKPEDENIDTQALINDVEDFLQSYEGTNTSSAALVDGSKDMPLANSTFTEEETKAAEMILDSLLQGEIDIDPNLFNSLDENMEVVDTETPAANVAPTNSAEVIKQEAAEHQILGDSGFFDLSSVSQIVTEDGRNVIIMVAPPSPTARREDDNIPTILEEAPTSIVVSKADGMSMLETPVSPAASMLSDADSEWTPEAATSSTSARSAGSKGRPMVKRNNISKTKAGGMRKTSYSAKDKKERKKLQNVEAARRYRDKKKAEQNDIDSEEAALTERNKTLTAEVTELESEIRTMRKLMMELGILKQ